jgi:hypothetical protein
MPTLVTPPAIAHSRLSSFRTHVHLVGIQRVVGFRAVNGRMIEDEYQATAWELLLQHFAHSLNLQPKSQANLEH